MGKFSLIVICPDSLIPVLLSLNKTPVNLLKTPFSLATKFLPEDVNCKANNVFDIAGMGDGVYRPEH